MLCKYTEKDEEIERYKIYTIHEVNSLPVGKERVEFNAHRIFYPATVVDAFGEMELIEFSCATETEIEHNVSIHKYDSDMHNGNYRFGLFHFRKTE